MRLARKLTLALATTTLVIYSSGIVRSDEPHTGDDRTMEIVPLRKFASTSSPVPAADPADADTKVHTVDAAEYRRVYDSIPFSRAEYRVNPGYRHDSTMEILTGNARHQTIVKHDHKHKSPVRPNPAPARPSRVLSPFTGWNSYFAAPYWFRGGF